MARSIWSGAISFGLVNVPVKLYSAVSRKTVRFHQLNSETGHRVAQKRVDSVTGDEVPYEQIVKGFELTKDRYVVVTPEELDSIAPEKTRAIDIEDFVDLEDIDPIFYDHPYYLVPDKGAGKAYGLLLEAMRESGKVAIARVVLRSKEQLVAIRPAAGDVLTMETMIFHDEVVPADDLEEVPDAKDLKTSDRELKMAQQLIASLASDFEPSKYHDEYREKVLELIERKADGEEIAIQPEAEEPTKVPDLMAALEASLAAVKDPGAGRQVQRQEGRRRRRFGVEAEGEEDRIARQGRREEVTRARSGNTHRMSPRLRRADCSTPGLTRRRQGKGFTYLDAEGEKVTEPEDLSRISELGIPPAWKDVWICPDARGHLQATGVDAAGRKQYLYHPQWRTRRDSEKFDEMIDFARALPALRERVDEDLTATDQLTRERVLACAVRLLDRGFFRIGSEQYTVQNESFGLATMRKEHVSLDPEHRGMVFDYIAKSGKRRIQGVVDPAAFDGGLHAQAPPRRRRGAARLPERPRLGRRPLARHQRVPQGGHRRRLLGQGLPHLGGDDAGGDRAGRERRGRGHEDRAQARDRQGGQGGLALPRQHARGLPRLLHRPARDRRLQRRADHPRGAQGHRRHRRARRAADPPARRRAGRARPAQ